MTFSDFLKTYSLSTEEDKLKIYTEAVTHTSFSNENKQFNHYERLEFLGDSVLKYLLAKKIFMDKPGLSEGDMSMMRAYVEKDTNLSKLNKNIGLNKFIKYGNGVDLLRDNDKILADVFEAFIAAILLADGETKLNEFLSLTIFKEIDSFNKDNLKDPKSKLQEHLQTGPRAQTPTYEDEQIAEGKFKSTVIHDGIVYGTGYGASKKLAQKDAAEKALEIIANQNTKNVIDDEEEELWD